MAVKAIHWDQLMPCNTLWPLITLVLPLIHDSCVVCSLSIELKPSKTGFPLTVWQVSQRPLPASTSLTSVISSIPLLSLWIITVLTVIMDNDYFGNDSFWDCSAQHGMVFISECLSSTWNTQNSCCHEDDCPLGEQPGDNVLYIVITCLSVYCEHIAAHIVYNVKTVIIDFCTEENTPHAWGRTLLWVISRRELIWTQDDEQFSTENLEMSSDCDCQVRKIIKRNKKTNDKRLMTSLINPKEQTW